VRLASDGVAPGFRSAPDTSFVSSVAISSQKANEWSRALARMSTLGRLLQDGTLDVTASASANWLVVSAFPLLTKLAASNQVVFGSEWARRFREFRNE